MSLRSVRTVVGRVIALSAAGLVVFVLGLSVIVPRLGGATAYTVLTGSMRPGMPPGTLVVVRSIAPEDIKVGDVVTFQMESGDPAVATHRVKEVGVSLDGTYHFTTKGDANGASDVRDVRPEQIRGVRWYSVPYLASPSLLVGGDIRKVVVTGSVALLVGYSITSFAGAALDRRRRRHENRAGEPAVEKPARERSEIAS